MLEPESSQWQVALTVMENVRDVQRRAESDSLRYIGLVAAFLAIRGSATSSLSILGLEIHDAKLIQFALVPAAAFFAVRYAKAQVLTGSLARFLRSHLAKLPGASPMTCPPDWDIVRDMTHRFSRVHKLLPGGLEPVMYALVVAGTVANLLDSTDTNRSWAWLATAATALLFATTLPAMSTWETALIGRERESAPR